MDELIEALKELAEALKNNEKIKVTIVKREETPDGPLHTREVKEINARDLTKKEDK